MSNVFVIIKMCYVHNQWYDISCAILYMSAEFCDKNHVVFFFLNKLITSSSLQLYPITIHYHWP